jgi:hypothetical protein
VAEGLAPSRAPQQSDRGCSGFPLARLFV